MHNNCRFESARRTLQGKERTSGHTLTRDTDQAGSILVHSLLVNFPKIPSALNLLTRLIRAYWPKLTGLSSHRRLITFPQSPAHWLFSHWLSLTWPGLALSGFECRDSGLNNNFPHSIKAKSKRETSGRCGGAGSLLGGHPPSSFHPRQLRNRSCRAKREQDERSRSLRVQREEQADKGKKVYSQRLRLDVSHSLSKLSTKRGENTRGGETERERKKNSNDGSQAQKKCTRTKHGEETRARQTNQAGREWLSSLFL